MRQVAVLHIVELQPSPIFAEIPAERDEPPFEYRRIKLCECLCRLLLVGNFQDSVHLDGVLCNLGDGFRRPALNVPHVNKRVIIHAKRGTPERRPVLLLDVPVLEVRRANL